MISRIAYKFNKHEKTNTFKVQNRWLTQGRDLYAYTLALLILTFSFYGFEFWVLNSTSQRSRAHTCLQTWDKYKSVNREQGQRLIRSVGLPPPPPLMPMTIAPIRQPDYWDLFGGFVATKLKRLDPISQIVTRNLINECLLVAHAGQAALEPPPRASSGRRDS